VTDQLMSPWQAALAGLGLVVALMVAVWIGSVLRRDASLVDRIWGLGFVLLAVLYHVTGPAAGGWTGPAGLLVVLTGVWGLRLSAFLTWRNWGQGEDYRYREMRARGGPAFPVRSLVTVFLLQGVLMWLIGAPLLPAARATAWGAGWLTGLGAALWAVGFFFEAVGDWQLARFKADPANRGRVLDRGVWRYTRHPNYFGDACVWWGLWCLAAAQGAWWTVFAPALMTLLLLRVSGVVMLERKLVESRPAYRDYVRTTSAFVPWPPRRIRDAP
jgi:steroid 5-alpha reductase family enzyme